MICLVEHISDGTSCWTVILIYDRVAILLGILSDSVELYIWCRPLVGRLFFIPHIIRVCPSDRWQEFLGLYFYRPVPYHIRISHSGKFPVCIFDSLFFLLYCVSYLLLLGRGFWPVVGRGFPFSVFSGFLRVASMSGVALVN